MKSSGALEHRFSFIIEGEGLPVEQIAAQLGLEPTKVIRRGDVLNRLPEIVAEADEWVHTVDLTAPDGVDEGLNVLLAALMAHKAELDAIKAQWKASMRLYVQSDYAQIAYSLMPETLTKLVAVGLPLEVSTLSWGVVDI